MKYPNIAVLGSTRGTDMQAIIDNDIPVRIVVSNKREAYILERAKKASIPTYVTKDEKEIMRILAENRIELILLIGYMRYLSKEFVEKYRNRIMNIHPSLLPAFAGGMDKNVHQTILDWGCKVTGCTLHFVDEGADTGPIILQKAIAIEENDTVDSLKEKVQKAEQEIILQGIKLFAENRLRVEGRKVRIL